MKITTDSTPPGEPKDKDSNSLFSFYSHFANEELVKSMEKKYSEGISWGEVKQEIFEVLNEILKDKREIYEHYLASDEELNQIFKEGSQKAREVSVPIIEEIKKTIF